MRSLFQKAQDRVERKREQVEAVRNADPSKVTRIPNGRMNPLTLNSYEKGVQDGMEGAKRRAPGSMEQKEFASYARGYEAGERNRLRSSKPAPRSRFVVPERPIPSDEQIAAELARREAGDEARKERLRRTGILDALRLQA
jgi:hypothetical protein